jgi:hypothetical protein
MNYYFHIDNAYLISVTETTVFRLTPMPKETSEDFLVRKLKSSNNPIRTLSSKDHPEFTKLRDRLEADGYINTERGMWNGDRVLKAFYLNDKKFDIGDKFYCASAMGYWVK